MRQERETWSGLIALAASAKNGGKVLYRSLSKESRDRAFEMTRQILLERKIEYRIELNTIYVKNSVATGEDGCITFEYAKNND